MDPKRFRKQQVATLTDRIGVYALCDLDGVPMYVGQSVDGIRARVQRHLTSARSDIIANRQIDVWEIAHVSAWPVTSAAEIDGLEGDLFTAFDVQVPLMNGKTFRPAALTMPVLPAQQVQVILEELRLDRLRPEVRLPRQIAQYLNLVDDILTVKDEPHLKRTLAAHFSRLVRYHDTFLTPRLP